MRSSEEPWPRDPRLDPFRNGVWELSDQHQVVAYLITEVSQMRSFPLLWVKQESMWFQVNWVDGRREPLEEDYGPGWYAVAELEQGIFCPAPDGDPLSARALSGPERDVLWERYGPPTV